MKENFERLKQGERNLAAALPPENPNSPKNPNYKPSNGWQVLSCDETTDPNRVGGMVDLGGGISWYFEALKTAYPFRGDDEIRIDTCLGAATREDDILATPFCHASGQLRKTCEELKPLPTNQCMKVPDPRGCMRFNAICAQELAVNAQAPNNQMARPNVAPAQSAAVGKFASFELTEAEMDSLRTRLMACWNPPVGAAEVKTIIVHFALNRDGSLAGEPTVVNQGAQALFQTVAASAVSAVRRCVPFQLPASKYEAWREVEVKFEPREVPAQAPAADRQPATQYKPNWQKIEADNGAISQIDLNSIRLAGSGVEAGIYSEEDGDFNLMKIKRAFFDCHGHMQIEMARAINLAPRSVGARLAAIACARVKRWVCDSLSHCVAVELTE